MSETPETPQQRQLRIRQQKREAKLKAQGQERLDKITQLSGRKPETSKHFSWVGTYTCTSIDNSLVRNESPVISPSVSLPSTPAQNDPGQDPDVVLPTSAMFGRPNEPEQQRLQEEYMRMLMGGNQPNQTGAGPGQQPEIDENDPMIKMMQTMLGGMSGDPNAPGEMPFSGDDISKMTGIPSFLTNMIFGGPKEAPLSPRQVQTERFWKVLRTVVSFLVAFYTIFTIDKSISAFGQHPPAPATAQNPFVVFLMAELLINGTKIVFPGRPVAGGLKSWFRTGKDAARDGAIVVFVLGIYSWFRGST